MRKLLFLLLVLCGPLLMAENANTIGLGVNCDLGSFKFGTAASPWRQIVLGMAVDPNSASWNQTYSSRYVHIDFYSGATVDTSAGIPYNCVDTRTQRSYPVQMLQYGGDSDNVLFPFDPLTIAVEGGMPACPFDAGTNGGDGNDHHILSLDRYTGWLWAVWVGSWCPGRGWNAANGNLWDTSIDELRPYGLASEDAAGLSVMAGLATYYECVTHPTYVSINGVSSPTCGHALRFTMDHPRCAGYLGEGVGAYVPPSSHSTPACSGGGFNIEGMRIRLRASYDTSALTGEALAIANTWKAFGGIMADFGSTFFSTGPAPPTRAGTTAGC